MKFSDRRPARCDRSPPGVYQDPKQRRLQHDAAYVLPQITSHLWAPSYIIIRIHL